MSVHNVNNHDIDCDSGVRQEEEEVQITVLAAAAVCLGTCCNDTRGASQTNLPCVFVAAATAAVFIFTISSACFANASGGGGHSIWLQLTM